MTLKCFFKGHVPVLTRNNSLSVELNNVEYVIIQHCKRCGKVYFEKKWRTKND